MPAVPIYANVTIPSASGYNHTMQTMIGAAAQATVQTSGGTLAWNNPSQWQNAAYQSVSIAPSKSNLVVTGDAEFSGDITIGGMSLKDFMQKIEQRLAILVPDPVKLRHYEALQRAYEEYKILEALCANPPANTDDPA
jgi:hypothetical protein